MGEISRVTLFGKLNPVAYKTIEGATVFCKLRGNPYVELEHWVAQILQTPDTDWHRIIKHYGLDNGILAKDLTAALDPVAPPPSLICRTTSARPWSAAGSMAR
jgi:type VI secretion system protein VasG